MKLKFTFFALLILVFSGTKAQDYRYTEPIFSAPEKTSDVIYGAALSLDSPYADETSSQNTNLLLDVYSPVGDTETNRPLIIFAHGGGFITGNRNHDDILAFCDLFAKRGYVTASIDYRQGMYLLGNDDHNKMSSIRAVYRGLQDGRSAVRYFRNNAAKYGIDPNKIYFAGSSAGGFIALHSTFMNEESEKPLEAKEYEYTPPAAPPLPAFPITAPDLGAYDTNDHLFYTGTNTAISGQANAILSLWGAVASTDLILATDTIPTFLVHGESDITVPFVEGSPFKNPSMPATQGSKLINERLIALGQSNFGTYFIANQGHEFYGVTNGMWSPGTSGNEYWAPVVAEAVQFFHEQHKPKASFSYNGGSTISFTENCTNAISYLWDFGDGTATSSELNPEHSYSSDDTYPVTLYIENSHGNWDKITKQVQITGTGVNTDENQNFSIYPNPVQDIFSLSSSAGNSLKDLTIYDLTGKIILHKSFTEKQTTIDLSPYSNGVYLLKLKDKDSISKLKIVKK